MEKGADINIEGEFKETPLFNACKWGNEDIVKYLVEKRADINKENRWAETPLFSACTWGNEDIVKYLVEKGADINKETVTIEPHYFLLLKRDMKI